MKTLRMTDRWVSNVSVESGRAEYVDAVAKGLRLRVSKRTKSWSIVSRGDGRQKRIALGSYPGISLSSAREQANRILVANDQQEIEKIVGQNRVVEAPSLESLISSYVEQMKAKGQPSFNEYQRSLVDSPNSFLCFMKAQLRRTPRVSDVQTSHVADWLREIYQRAPAQASHCRAYLHAVFAWALRAEFDYTASDGQQNFGIEVNPVSATPSGRKSKARQRVLSQTELRRLWHGASEFSDPMTVIALRMIIAMGGLRISEVLFSRLEWYNNGWLTLPETKNGREHSIPLTNAAKLQFAKAVEAVEPSQTFLFPHQTDAQKPMLTTSLGRAVRRGIEKNQWEHFQLRDLRRTMKTHLLDGEYVEEREIDIWHNHGQNTDVARKHYSWAEYKKLKLRVASKIDEFLEAVLSQTE